MQSVQQNRDSGIICWVRWLKHSRVSLIFTMLFAAAEVAFCCLICVFICTSWKGGKNWSHWANLEAEGFAGCGEGADGGAVGSRGAQGEQAEHSWASCGKENALLSLIFGFFSLFLPSETSSQFASLIFIYTQLSFGFSFNKCQMILKLTWAISEWYFCPWCDSVSPQCYNF